MKPENKPPSGYFYPATYFPLTSSSFALFDAGSLGVFWSIP